jgi:hypothetical protein
MRKTFAFITEENDKWGSKAFLVWNSFHFDKVSENAKKCIQDCRNKRQSN